MDNKRIVEILKGTIDSQYRQEAEEQLNQVKNTEIPQSLAHRSFITKDVIICVYYLHTVRFASVIARKILNNAFFGGIKIAYLLIFCCTLLIVFFFIKVHKIIGFAPALLQTIMTPDVELPVRQAGMLLIYLSQLLLID
jgi:hypothetical protein